MEKLEQELNELEKQGEFNKEAIVELEDSTLVKLGFKRVTKDNFRIEPKIESLEIEK